MYGTNTIGTGLTFTKVLGGISKALGIANQAIPIYKEVKPMISNARKIMSVVKEINTPSKNVKKTLQAVSIKEKETDIKPVSSSSSLPVFFQ